MQREMEREKNTRIEAAPRTGWTPAMSVRVVGAYKRGVTLLEAGKAAGVGKHRARRMILSAGVSIRHHQPRTGTLYSEMTNKGRESKKLVRGCKPVYCFNWVGEITVRGKRYRKRNPDRRVVEFWLERMVARYKDDFGEEEGGRA